MAERKPNSKDEPALCQALSRTKHRRDAFDLLISDAGLPDGTGAELMTRLRAVQPVPGVAISGFGVNGDVQKSLAAGFSTHLIKPITFEQLEESIARTINGAAGGS